MSRATRPPPSKSGRAPKREPGDDDDGYSPVEPIARGTLVALTAAVCIQTEKRVPEMGKKSRHLSRVAADLEMAFIVHRPKAETDRLCLDVAALAIRIFEQGD